MYRTILIAALFCCGGCDRTVPADQARSDARAVAQVEAAQHAWPAPVLLVPQALVVPPDTACILTDPARAAGAPILAIGPRQGLMRAGGLILTFVADPGATALPHGARSRYTGRAFSLTLTPLPTLATPTPVGFTAGPRQPVTLTVTDEHERPVLEAVGDLTCGG